MIEYKVKRSIFILLLLVLCHLKLSSIYFSKFLHAFDSIGPNFLPLLLYPVLLLAAH